MHVMGLCQPPQGWSQDPGAPFALFRQEDLPTPESTDRHLHSTGLLPVCHFCTQISHKSVNISSKM